MIDLFRRQNDFLGWVREGLHDSLLVTIACIEFRNSKIECIARTIHAHTGADRGR